MIAADIELHKIRRKMRILFFQMGLLFLEQAVPHGKIPRKFLLQLALDFFPEEIFEQEQHVVFLRGITADFSKIRVLACKTVLCQGKPQKLKGASDTMHHGGIIAENSDFSIFEFLIAVVGKHVVEVPLLEIRFQANEKFTGLLLVEGNFIAIPDQFNSERCGMIDESPEIEIHALFFRQMPSCGRPASKKSHGELQDNGQFFPPARSFLFPNQATNV